MFRRTIAAKLALFIAAMLNAAGHGTAVARRRTQLPRVLGMRGLVSSAGVLLLAATLAG